MSQAATIAPLRSDPSAAPNRPAILLEKVNKW